jgi:hypothetical protein
MTKMNMTSKGRTVFRRKCELTGTKSAWEWRRRLEAQKQQANEADRLC